MEKLGVPELTTDQIEVLCSNAESAARKYVLSQVPLKMLEKLDISVEAEGIKPLNLTVDVDLQLAQQKTKLNLKELVDGAAKEAIKASEEFLSKLK